MRFVTKIHREAQSILWKLYARHKYKAYISRSVKISVIPSIGMRVYLGGQTSILEGVTIADGVRIEGNIVLRNIQIGENSQIERNVTLMGHGNGRIKIGRECYIGSQCILDYSGSITIGDFVHFSAATGVWTHSSAPMCMNSIPLKESSSEFRPIGDVVIRDNVYIGGLSTIYPGVVIGSSSIIAPNSAVAKTVDDHTMVGGVPAVLIKSV